MFRLAIGFLLLAVVAGILGFAGPAGLLAQVSRILFYVFLILFAGLTIVSLFKRGQRDLPPPP
ncbi:MAG: DUF1328 domain-containing protein [Candidatus Hydrogenedentota bacterium]